MRRIATGVTACQQLLDEAIAWGADAILVHHGYFWRGEAEPVVGMKRRRLAALLNNDVSLLAYHLPLDGHPQLGNNATLGELMGIPCARHQALPGATVGSIAELDEAVPARQLVASLEQALGRDALYIGDPDVRGLHHCVFEVLDNSIDEHLAGYCSLIRISIHVDGSISIDSITTQIATIQDTNLQILQYEEGMLDWIPDVGGISKKLSKAKYDDLQKVPVAGTLRISSKWRVSTIVFLLPPIPPTRLPPTRSMSTWT